MKKSTRVWLLILILIIAVFFRLYHITTVPPGLYPDEAMNGNNGTHANLTGNYSVFYPENNGREGLFINIQALALKYSGIREPWVLRSVSAAFGILTVLGVFFLAMELFGIEVALLAAFFIATGFWHILFSRIGFRAISSPFWLTWAVYFLLLGYRKLREGKPFAKSTLWHVIGGLFFGIGINSYIAYRVAPALIAFIMLYFVYISYKEGWLKRCIHTSLHYIIFAIPGVVPLFLYFATHAGSFFGRTAQVSVMSAPHPALEFLWNALRTFQMFFLFGDYNWRQNLSGHAELFWPVAILFGIGIIIGIVKIAEGFCSPGNADTGQKGGIKKPANWLDKIFNDSSFSYWVLFVWFLVALLPVALSDEGIPHALRSILMVPPVYILAGAAALYAYRWLGKYVHTFWLPLFAGLFFVALTFQAYYSYFIQWAQNPNTQGAFAAQYVDVGRQINTLIAQKGTATPIYVIVPDTSIHDPNDLPINAETTMFITDTYEPAQRAAKNIHYVIGGHEGQIPQGAMVFKLQ